MKTVPRFPGHILIVLLLIPGGAAAQEWTGAFGVREAATYLPPPSPDGTLPVVVVVPIDPVRDAAAADAMRAALTAGAGGSILAPSSIRELPPNASENSLIGAAFAATDADVVVTVREERQADGAVAAAGVFHWPAGESSTFLVVRGSRLAARAAPLSPGRLKRAPGKPASEHVDHTRGTQTYFVSNAAWQQLATLSPRERRGRAIDALRKDGTEARVRADSVVGNASKVSPRCWRITARRGRGKIAAGIPFVAVGAPIVAGGVAAIALDTSRRPGSTSAPIGLIAGGALIAVGGSQLLLGLSLIGAGRGEGPEDGTNEMSLVAGPQPASEVCAGVAERSASSTAHWESF